MARPVDSSSPADSAGPACEPGPAVATGPTRHLDWFSGAMVVAANMVGMGVFTTAGYMLGALGSPPAVLLAWVVGGIAAVCGGLCYAELGAALPRNGGEFQLLSRIYHPLIGLTTMGKDAGCCKDGKCTMGKDAACCKDGKCTMGKDAACCKA